MLGFGQMWPGPNRAILHDKTPFEPVRASVAAGAVDIDDTFTLRLAAGTLATEARVPMKAISDASSVAVKFR